MKKIIISLLLIQSISLLALSEKKPKLSDNKVQVALLLDTSNSMDGLINQAKSRLWNIVNTLTTLRYKGKIPRIEICLYEYGNDGLSRQDNYIRKVTPLTTDLDLISEKLFSLRTNGGSEYCGAVINDAIKNLDWDDGSKAMKLIYISGNEPFDQGSLSYKEAISDAKNKNIYVNTIFCGSKQEGINTFWKDGADRGGGEYFYIDSHKKIYYIVTPYDDKINICNNKLNATYIGYGAQGRYKKQNQILQDEMAGSISKSNQVQRAVVKSKEAYTNEEWDLVDKYKASPDNLEKINKKDLPKELQNKTKKELETYVKEKLEQRKIIKQQLSELAKKRQEYIYNKQKEQKRPDDDLGVAIEKSIISLAKKKGYKILD